MEVKKKLTMGVQWFFGDPYKNSQYMCETRDVFKARVEHLDRELLKKFKNHEAEVALVSAIIYEIGHNCFDHNLGKWRDVVGCWYQCEVDQQQAWFLLADRGQGILASLKNVVPNLKTDQEALQIAFEKKISGRSPEKRGNGLKFVRGVINANSNRGLFCVSGQGRIYLGGRSKDISSVVEQSMFGEGTLTVINWIFES
ncbi:MAG: hypothetical protein HYY61_01580 [Deltaproteobacteria bacterium]|nr:hypothetical protein [Deltaproteobacteria bacterium]